MISGYTVAEILTLFGGAAFVAALSLFVAGPTFFEALAFPDLGSGVGSLHSKPAGYPCHDISQQGSEQHDYLFFCVAMGFSTESQRKPWVSLFSKGNSLLLSGTT